jgi:hypothetical protein
MLNLENATAAVEDNNINRWLEPGRFEFSPAFDWTYDIHSAVHSQFNVPRRPQRAKSQKASFGGIACALGSDYGSVPTRASGLKFHSLSFFAAVPNGPSWYTAAPAGEKVNGSNGSASILSR